MGGVLFGEHGTGVTAPAGVRLRLGHDQRPTSIQGVEVDGNSLRPLIASSEPRTAQTSPRRLTGAAPHPELLVAGHSVRQACDTDRASTTERLRFAAVVASYRIPQVTRLVSTSGLSLLVGVEMGCDGQRHDGPPWRSAGWVAA